MFTLDRKFFKNFDFTLFFSTLALMILSIIFVASASSAKSGNYYFTRQLVWVVGAVVVMFVTLKIDYNTFWKFSRLIYLANIALLLAVLAVGRTSKYGGTHWIWIGPIPLQPSEFSKVFTILTLAKLLVQKENKLNKFSDLFPVFFHIGIPFGLVILQGDLGTALVFIAILFGMLFVAGVKVKHLATLVGAGVAVMPVVWNFLKDYQKKRLIVFINPEMDKLGAGWNIIQSKIAIGSGGILGKGIFAGSQNRLEFLPESHTDFIFSVIGEEVGFLGSGIVLLLFFIIIWRGIKIAGRAKDMYGVLIAIGITSMFFFHVFENVGMALGIMPITGIPLPFVSYGGSAMFTNALSLGLLLNIYFRRQKIRF
ncbi:MAG TPA: rod shape-determining protein RodA [Clostridia bacterium]|nr:rod shape-determining protein RodA [Clostridia bacterium]